MFVLASRGSVLVLVVLSISFLCSDATLHVDTIGNISFVVWSLPFSNDTVEMVPSSSNTSGKYGFLSASLSLTQSSQRSDSQVLRALVDQGAVGIIVCDRSEDIGSIIATNAVPGISVPIGFVSLSSCAKILAKINTAGVINVTVNGSDENLWSKFFLSPAYSFWNFSLICFWILLVIFASFRLSLFIYYKYDFSFQMICLLLVIIANLLRILHFVFVPLTNRFLIPNMTVLATFCIPWNLTVSILIVFFWLDLTSGKAFSGKILDRLRIPAGITIFVLFCVEIFVDCFKTLTSVDSNMVVFVAAIYSIVNLGIGIFYFVAAKRVLKAAQIFKRSKSKRVQMITYKIVTQGVSMCLTFFFGVLMIIFRTRVAPFVSLNYLLWVSFGFQSLTQILIFSPDKKHGSSSAASSETAGSKNGSKSASRVGDTDKTLLLVLRDFSSGHTCAYSVVNSMDELQIKHDKGKLTIINQPSLTSIPEGLGRTYGDKTTELAITYCQLTHVSHLTHFTKLTSLILDNNEIRDDNNDFPTISSLETLWINCNNLSYLESFLAKIQGKYPKLKYLSLLKNPCCANYFVGKGSEDYKKYRATVLCYIPHLKFLDSSPVLPEELEAAEKLRRAIIKPDEAQYKKHAEFAVPEELALPKDSSAQKNEKARFGKTQYVYQGEQSEGNRFIVDKNL